MTEIVKLRRNPFEGWTCPRCGEPIEPMDFHTDDMRHVPMHYECSKAEKRYGPRKEVLK